MPFQPFSWPSNLFGSPEELYGSKPKVPESPDFSAVARRQIEGNIANLPSLTELARMSTDELNNLLERSMPGYADLRDSATDTLTSWARGELTPEMDADIKRRAAELGVGLGTTQSQFSGLHGVKLGLDTRLGLQQKALAAAPSWIASAQSRTFDFTKMFLFDPFREGEFNWQRDWLAAQVKAGPDPVAAGQAEAELTGAGIAAGIFGGNAYQGGVFQGRPTYAGGPGSGGGAGGAGGGSFFGTGNYVATSGGGAPGGMSFADYYGGGGGGSGVSPYAGVGSFSDTGGTGMLGSFF